MKYSPFRVLITAQETTTKDTMLFTIKAKRILRHSASGRHANKSKENIDIQMLTHGRSNYIGTNTGFWTITSRRYQ